MSNSDVMLDVSKMTPEQWRELKPLVAKEVGQGVSDEYTKSLQEEMGMFMGEFATVPVSLVVRMTGWNISWIKRNLPIIKAEGQVDAVQIKDIKQAIQTRKAS